MKTSNIHRLSLQAESLIQGLDAWTKKHKISDPTKRQKLRDVLNHWMAEPRHQFHFTPTPNADEIEACAIIKLTNRNDVPQVMMFSNSKSGGEVRVIKLTMRKEELRVLNPLQIAFLSFNDNFGSRYFDNSGYVGNDGFVHDFYPAAMKEKINRAADFHINKLVGELYSVIDGKNYEKLDVSLPSTLYEEIYKAASRFERRNIQLVINQFTRFLDQDALRVMRRDKSYIRHIYEWLAGKDTNKFWDRRSTFQKQQIIDPIVSVSARRNRQQAGWAFPCLLSYMEDKRPLSDAIDRGYSLVSAILEDLNAYRDGEPEVSTEMIKYLWGVRTGDIDPGFLRRENSNMFYPGFHNSLYGFSALPPEWRPRMPEQWEEMSRGILHKAAQWSKITDIVSIAGKDGLWRTTLELRMRKNEEVTVLQHKGEFNQQPNVWSREAAKWLITGLNDGSIPCRRAEVEVQEAIREQERLKNRFEDILLKTGFDPRDAEARENAYKAWHHMQRSLFSISDRREYCDAILGAFVEHKVAEFVERSILRLSQADFI